MGRHGGDSAVPDSCKRTTEPPASLNMLAHRISPLTLKEAEAAYHSSPSLKFKTSPHEVQEEDLEREYDLSTWRMYHRIQAARAIIDDDSPRETAVQFYEDAHVAAFKGSALAELLHRDEPSDDTECFFPMDDF